MLLLTPENVKDLKCMFSMSPAVKSVTKVEVKLIHLLKGFIIQYELDELESLEIILCNGNSCIIKLFKKKM